MNSRADRNTQAGFSLIELIVAITVFLIIIGAAFSLMGNAVRVSTTHFEMTDTQESLRFAQEYINRDLVVAGADMKTVRSIRLPTGFVTSYLTADQVNPVGGFVNIEILTPDNNVATAFTTPANPPTGTPLSVAPGTDRISILSNDSTFTSVSVLGSTNPPAAVGSPTMAAANPRIRVNFFTAAETNVFNVGEIYYLESTDGLRKTFAAVTAKNTGGNNITFGATADPYGLNPAAANAPIQWISTDPLNPGVKAFTIRRIQIFHYFVRSNTVNGVTSGLLTRRVIGVAGSGYTDAVIAEHVVNLQIRYQLGLRDVNNQLRGPVDQFATSQEQISVRQVEVSVTTESTHLVNNGVRQQVTSTTSTSIRNLPFQDAL